MEVSVYSISAGNYYISGGVEVESVRCLIHIFLCSLFKTFEGEYSFIEVTLFTIFINQTF